MLEIKSTPRKQKDATYKGHIVHCRDIDGGSEFNVEIFVLDDPRVDAIKKAEESALKHELCTMTGNTHEVEYLQPSGLVFVTHEIVWRDVVSQRNSEGEGLLDGSTWKIE